MIYGSSDAPDITATSNGNGHSALSPQSAALPPLDRTPKHYIGGKQARPDSGYSRPVHDPRGHLIGEVGDGNRKDIRNAVEAARTAAGWAGQTAHNRAQILYYIAENLSARADEFAQRLRAAAGYRAEAATQEVEAAIGQLFTYAAWADKYDGAVHGTPTRTVTLAVPEPIGVIGIACPDAYPLLACVTSMAAAISMGNTIVLLPSERHPLSATDLYQVLDTSDLPGGVVNIVTGAREALAKVLAEHNNVDALWYFGGGEGGAMVERASISNLKQTWTGYGEQHDWLHPDPRASAIFLRHATQVKNIWVPYGA